MRLTKELWLDRQDRPACGVTTADCVADTVGSSCQDLILISESAEDTEKLGAALADFLVAGSVVSLEGDLGAGKTLFTRGLARGLRCLGAVASPTFTILMEHPAGETGLPLFHFDVYRLLNSDEFIELGFDEYLDGEGVCVIEWGDLIRDILPERTIRLIFTAVDDARQNRQIAICWPDGKVCLDQLAHLAGMMAGQIDDRPEAGGKYPC